MTDIVNPIDPPVVPPVPQRNDEATFEDRSDAGWEFAFETLPGYMQDTMDNVHQNAVATNERALAADQRATDAESAKQAAEDARDKAQDWAEGVEPAPGSKSAKGWAQEGEDAKDSAWAAAAAAGVSAGLPEPLVPGKVLGATSPSSVGWVDAISNLKRVEITTSQTWTPPFYPFNCIIDAIGGGSGGAGSASSPDGGRGGCSGFVDFPIFVTLEEGDVLEIIIGAGGSGGPPEASPTPGGDTFVSLRGQTIVTAQGGNVASGSGAGGLGGLAGPPATAGNNGGRFGANSTTVNGIFTSGGNLSQPNTGLRYPFIPPDKASGAGGLGGAAGGTTRGGGGGGGGGFGPGGNGGAGDVAGAGGRGEDGAPGGGGGGGGGNGGGGGGAGGNGGVGMVRIYF